MIKTLFKQKGIAIPTFTIAVLALIGIGGLAIDISNHYVTKTLLQNALDASALAGAKVLNESNDEDLASDAALTVFNMHLSGKLADSGIVPTFEYSTILNPFTPGGLDPNYIRASVSDYDISFFLARVLPGVGDTQTVVGSAVAGPLPLSSEDGDEICGVAPILLCGDDSDDDCTDGECFGYVLDDDDPTYYELKTGAGSGWAVGAGNFQLLSLTCGTGGRCVRDGLAGTENLCITVGETETTEPGNTVGPVNQGFNTRFGDYTGAGMNIGDHPPDTVVYSDPGFDPGAGDFEAGVTPNTFWYSDYQDVKSGGSLEHPGATIEYPAPTGQDGRRILTVPVGNCTGTENGRGEVEIYGVACMFMIHPATHAGNTQFLYGQITRQGCQAEGGISETPPPVGEGLGPYEIVLYKNSDSIDT